MTTTKKKTVGEVVLGVLRLIANAKEAPPLRRWVVLVAIANGAQTRKDIWEAVGQMASSSVSACVRLKLIEQVSSTRPAHYILTPEGEALVREIISGK